MTRALLSILSILCLGIPKNAARKKVDLLVHNAVVYTVDSNFTVARSFAVKDGKFLAVGTGKSLTDEYDADSVVDLRGKPVYPGLFDPHAHLLALGQGLDQANLVGAKSMEEVIIRMKEFARSHPGTTWLKGQGWDQNIWTDRQFPTKEQLDMAFPNVPVALTRIDGHASLVNSKALMLAGITSSTKIPGGEVILVRGEPTGVLIDNARDPVRKLMPGPSNEDLERALLAAQKACLSVGLTSVSDAGINRSEIDLVEQLYKSNKLKIRNYVMIKLNEPNLEYYLKRGPFQTDRLTVRSFKLLADGALGSRGAALRQPYSDRPETNGLLRLTPAEFERVLTLLANSEFQANTHCIGDSANHLALTLYAKMLKTKNNRRWRTEHAQIVSAEDFDLFGKYSIIPSVQPTHAISDMKWAAERLGPVRMKGAYAFRQLMKQNALIAFGSDFPVEAINPLFGFHAAVTRVDAKGFPKGGFQVDNAVDRRSALRAMTSWAAYANFEEHLRGSILPGKQADFVVLEQDIMKIPAARLRQVKVLQTWIAGERLF